MEYFSKHADRKAKSALSLIKRSTPEIRLRTKDTVPLLVVLAFILKPIHPKFMDAPMIFWNTLYLPKSIINSSYCWKILLHQSVHIFDMAIIGRTRFLLMYLWPQVLALGSLIGILGIIQGTFLFCLLFLLFLIPFPARMRLQIERRGYTMSLLLTWYLNKKEFAQYLDYLKESFIGSKYYYMATKSQWEEIYREWSRIPQISKYLVTGGNESLQTKSLHQIAPMQNVEPEFSALPYLRVIDYLGLFITPSKGTN